MNLPNHASFGMFMMLAVRLELRKKAQHNFIGQFKWNVPTSTRPSPSRLGLGPSGS